jgi:hypothetical protein
MDAEGHLQRLIPYRLDCLAILSLMLGLRRKWTEPKPMQILVDGRLQFEGLTCMFTNPIVESGILHIRALLEFLGLKVVNSTLATITPSQRKQDDAGIELLSVNGRALALVELNDVHAIHPESPAEAVTSLIGAINAAHKGMAHLTARYADCPVEAEHLLLAASVTQKLVHRHVYQALGLDLPPALIKARPRE